jgi:hypothetical protein
VQTVTGLLAEWQVARAVLADLERAEHPDVTDRLGRVWVWRGRGDLYRHCGTAAPLGMIDMFGVPRDSVLRNPNYPVLCVVCLDGRVQRVVPEPSDVLG